MGLTLANRRGSKLTPVVVKKLIHAAPLPGYAGRWG